MSALIGHPTGNPNSHQAALTYFESGCLEAFCVPWMPPREFVALVSLVPGMKGLAARLSRRTFEPLLCAPKLQGRLGEVPRLFLRATLGEDESLSYEANDWLMKTMDRALSASARINLVHGYEDCSLLQFRTARRMGKFCLYDMPIGYYPVWERLEAQLMSTYTEWASSAQPISRRFVRPDQKAEEMALSDRVLAPSDFVASTIREFHPDADIRIVPYGVDAHKWTARPVERTSGPLRFLFAGQCSLRKGTPLLLEAWRAANLKDAVLELVGPWSLARSKLKTLPPTVTWRGPVDQQALGVAYRSSDVFVFPTFFEGRALVVGEALASGLPVITTQASGAGDLIDAETGRLLDGGRVDELVEGLRWFSTNRDRLPDMSRAARLKAERTTWDVYRRTLRDAVADLIHD